MNFFAILVNNKQSGDKKTDKKWEKKNNSSNNRNASSKRKVKTQGGRKKIQPKAKNESQWKGEYQNQQSKNHRKSNRSRDRPSQSEENEEDFVDNIESPYDTLQVGMKLTAFVDRISHQGLICFVTLATGAQVEGIIYGAWYNRVRNVPYVKDDLIEVEVADIDREGMNLALIFAEVQYRRKVLILDLNGVLGEREKYSSGNTGKKRRFFLRPHFSEFITRIAKNFDLGVWSCCTFQNMDYSFITSLNIPILLAYHDNKSESKWPRRSVVAPAKPLFHKNLMKVYEEFRWLGPGDVVLMDNHVEKFERNPAFTSILLPSYNRGMEKFDNVLRNDQPLYQFLDAISEADDVREMIERFSAIDPSLFPPSHPSLNIMGEHDNSEARPVINTFLKTVIDRSDSMRRLWGRDYSSNDVIKNPKRGFGPKAIPFRRTHLPFLHPSPPGFTTNLYKKTKHNEAFKYNQNDGEDEYLVCEKIDGVRYHLFIIPNDSKAYFIDRSLSVFQMSDGWTKVLIDVFCNEGGRNKCDDLGWGVVRYGSIEEEL